jgi:phage terminase large subunit
MTIPGFHDGEQEPGILPSAKATETQIVIPNRWLPRDYQKPAWNALESGIKRLDLVWHRRAGKDIFSINYCATQCFQRPGLYWHVLPTYKQGRKIVWEGMTREGRPFLDAFPPELITRKLDQEMSLWLEGGALYQIVGADDVDRLVGTNPFGVVFSEFSLMDMRVWEMLRPILAENGGWAIFIYTPRGYNFAHDLHVKAQRNDWWFSEVLTIDDTKAVPIEVIEQQRAEGMPEELIQQEFYCSFEAPLVGAYYGHELKLAFDQNRIGKVPYDPALPVNTFWDLGMRDDTAIWFHQYGGREHRLIDFYHTSGAGLPHYVKMLREKPYVYGTHLVPHDAAVRELGTGSTRIETAQSLGVHLEIVRKIALDDGINATRMFLRKCYIDEEKCDYGLQALRQYTKQDSGERDLHNQIVYRDQPTHNWASHPADALRTGATGWAPPWDSGDKILAPQTGIV